MENQGRFHECAGCRAFVTVSRSWRQRPFLDGYSMKGYCGGCDLAHFKYVAAEVDDPQPLFWLELYEEEPDTTDLARFNVGSRL